MPFMEQLWWLNGTVGAERRSRIEDTAQHQWFTSFCATRGHTANVQGTELKLTPGPVLGCFVGESTHFSKFVLSKKTHNIELNLFLLYSRRGPGLMKTGSSHQAGAF